MSEKTVIVAGFGGMHFSACWRCGVIHAFPVDLYQLALQRGNDLTIFCPNGHGAVYTTGPTEADQLRQERDRMKQALAQRDDEIRTKQSEIERQRELRAASERRVSAARGQVYQTQKPRRQGCLSLLQPAFHRS